MTECRPVPHSVNNNTSITFIRPSTHTLPETLRLSVTPKLLSTECKHYLFHLQFPTTESNPVLNCQLQH